METPSVGIAGQQGAQSASANAALRGLNLDTFLTLMITELQNQDPLNPLDNSEILNQISQIREIEATSELRETLDAVLLGQNLSSATGMLKRRIAALDDQGSNVQGVVDRVSVAEGNIKLHVGTKQVSLTKVREVLPA
jgi:flagellar basal-body rod modification protein FlgD